MDPSPTPSSRSPDSARFRAVPALFRRRVPVFLLFGILVVLVVVFGALSLRMVSRRSLEVDSVRARLSSMTQVRQERLSAWLLSCSADADMVARFPSVRELLRDPDVPTGAGGIPESGDLAAHARTVLDMVVLTHGYGAILVVDSGGAILGSSVDPPSLDPEVARKALEAAAVGTSFFTDVAPDGTRPRLLFSWPVTRASASSSPPGAGLLGALLFLVDPVSAVYPMMTNRVTVGATDDVALAHLAGGQLRVMTPTRFPGEGVPGGSFLAPPIPHPVGDAGEAFLVTTDYRGKTVFASVRAVEGTPWLIVGKMDADEALEGVTGEWTWLLSTALATLLAVAILFVALSRHYRARHFQAVADQEARYRALAENARDIILIVDEDERVVEANRAACKAYGYPEKELIGVRLPALRAPGTLPSTADRLQQARAADIFYETEHRRRDGTTFPVEVSARGIRVGDHSLVVAILRDTTERKRLEKQSVIAQRMEALGQLAGGVAHDFNNLLTAIRGYAVLVQETLQHGDRRREELEEVVKASDRAANLTHQLLAFSRRQATERRVLDLNGVVQGLDGMLARLIGENIRFGTELEDRPLWVRADASQIENLLVNLVVNARDAMPHGGSLTLATRSVNLGVPGHERGREHARLEVIDTGVGMDDETRARAFEPFFTTKEPGRGTGLGLSTCYGIVQQHDGNIAIESAPGRGTTVRVDLPMAVRTLTDEIPIVTAGPAPRGVESILLAEDDEGVRSFTAQVLRGLGYRVVEAEGGPEAMDLVRTQADLAIDLLVTDVVMPGMSGVDLRNALREVRPGLRTLFVSGYAESSMFELGGVERGAPVLRKPFSPAELGRKVREVLDRKPRVTPPPPPAEA